MTTKLHQIFPGPRGSLGRAVATVLACLTLLTVPLGAQDRLKGMPGYDRFMEMAPQMAPSLVSGAVRPVWAEDGKSFQYAHAGTAYRFDVVTGMSSRIEGIGRPRVEPSFLPEVVDRMMTVPDAGSVAAAHHVSRVLNRRVGPSTGTNIWGAFGLLAEMAAAGCSGSVVTLLADSGDRYTETYFCAEWLTSHGLDPSESAEVLAEFERSGRWL